MKLRMRLEKQVIFLGKSKQVVLFIVEGITDEISLGLILEKIIEKEKRIRFKVINGDITSENGVHPTNILSKITKKIKEFLEIHPFNKDDIQNVIHLVDTDGAYIDNNMIKFKAIDQVEYDTNFIYTNNVENIKRRNERKSKVLNKLIETNKVYVNLPYQVYYFSSNLEHVLHNLQNLIDIEKKQYADIFVDNYADNPFNFIEFMNSTQIAASGDYKATWNFIKNGVNSLNRYSNFHLYLNEIEKY